MEEHRGDQREHFLLSFLTGCNVHVLSSKQTWCVGDRSWTCSFRIPETQLSWKASLRDVLPPGFVAIASKQCDRPMQTQTVHHDNTTRPVCGFTRQQYRGDMALVRHSPAFAQAQLELHNCPVHWPTVQTSTKQWLWHNLDNAVHRWRRWYEEHLNVAEPLVFYPLNDVWCRGRMMGSTPSRTWLSATDYAACEKGR